MRYSMNLVFETADHMSVSHVKRAVKEAVASEADRSEADDPFHNIDRSSIQVLRISAVDERAKEPAKP